MKVIKKSKTMIKINMFFNCCFNRLIDTLRKFHDHTGIIFRVNFRLFIANFYEQFIKIKGKSFRRYVKSNKVTKKLKTTLKIILNELGIDFMGKEFKLLLYNSFRLI